MSTRFLFSFVAVAAALYGCASTAPLVLDHAPVASAAHINCSSSPCRIKVLGTTVDYEELHLARGSTNLHIIWELPEGYGFCKEATSDGGVALKAGNDGQFTDMYSTDDPNGGPPANKDCRKHRRFHWVAKNSIPRPGNGYPYNIYFYDGAGGLHQIDPWIFND